jgi:hypothetical protein
MGLPRFTTCLTADRLEYYVLVRWPNGDAARINRFATLQDAEGWIARQSASWLEARAETHSIEREGPIAARVDVAQISRAA